MKTLITLFALLSTSNSFAEPKAPLCQDAAKQNFQREFHHAGAREADIVVYLKDITTSDGSNVVEHYVVKDKKIKVTSRYVAVVSFEDATNTAISADLACRFAELSI